MSNLVQYAEEFRLKFEKFLIGCDALEEMGLWDKERLGEMDVYYSNDLVGIIMQLIAADGQFSHKEVAYLNEIFGFDYTVEDLAAVVELCADGLDSLVDEEMENGLSLMRGLNSKLAAAYKELLALVCDIIMESDGQVDKAELAFAEQLKQDLRYV